MNDLSVPTARHLFRELPAVELLESLKAERATLLRLIDQTVDREDRVRARLALQRVDVEIDDANYQIEKAERDFSSPTKRKARADMRARRDEALDSFKQEIAPSWQGVASALERAAEAMARVKIVTDAAAATAADVAFLEHGHAPQGIDAARDAVELAQGGSHMAQPLAAQLRALFRAMPASVAIAIREHVEVHDISFARPHALTMTEASKVVEASLRHVLGRCLQEPADSAAKRSTRTPGAGPAPKVTSDINFASLAAAS